MAKKRTSKAIELIYTLFIGILLATFIGVGIATFYEAPEAPEYPAKLQVQRIPVDTGDTTQSAELIRDQETYDDLFDAYQEERKTYNRNVSIIALIGAVVILAISLTKFKELLVIADGLLLGGVITLLYSVVRVFESGDDKVRFAVVTVALIVSLVLGYQKFIKQNE